MQSLSVLLLNVQYSGTVCNIYVQYSGFTDVILVIFLLLVYAAECMNIGIFLSCFVLFIFLF